MHVSGLYSTDFWGRINCSADCCRYYVPTKKVSSISLLYYSNFLAKH